MEVVYAVFIFNVHITQAMGAGRAISLAGARFLPLDLWPPTRSIKPPTVNQQCDYDNCHALNCDNLFDYVTMTAIVHGFQLEEVIP